MSRKHSRKRTHLKPKAVLRLPDLDQAKSAVLNSLTSADAQRGYRHAIDEFDAMKYAAPFQVQIFGLNILVVSNILIR
jgi:hypothetical protein